MRWTRAPQLDSSRTKCECVDVAYDADPAWSPDGRIIAFASNRDGNYGVYLMNANGDEQRKLAQHTP